MIPRYAVGIVGVCSKRTNTTVRRAHRCKLQSNLTAYYLEFCYNIRYIDRHGRSGSEENPWSLRQIGVYERHDVEEHTSIWVLLQPSIHVCQRLKEGLQMNTSNTPESINLILQLHATIQFAASRHWADYIDHLRIQLEDLVRLSWQ